MKLTILIMLFGSLLGPTDLFAQPTSEVEAQLAQGVMLRDYRPRIAAYQAHLKLGSIFVDYCQTELNESHHAHAIDGSIPFGIDYHNVDRHLLRETIQARGSYEEAYLMLCLARAKSALRDAER